MIGDDTEDLQLLRRQRFREGNDLLVNPLAGLAFGFVGCFAQAVLGPLVSKPSSVLVYAESISGISKEK
ncbi:MAG: hypothetical protein DMF72_01250 [Acidobacteria bacterium]|nr:MAG: hypothetical protein DMF72_01250 [Acidobacteriota bacterium]